MKFLAIALLAASAAAPFQARACTSGTDELRKHARYYPIVGDTTGHWPARVTATIGSITSFLVPVDAKVQLKHLEQGMLAPLTILGEPSHEQIRTSRNLVPAWVDISYDARKFKWVHIYASSYGLSEVQMSGPKGWSKNVTVNLVYPSPIETAMRAPLELNLTAGDIPTAQADGRDNIEVTVAGQVDDGWTATPVSQTGFQLIRIEQVSKTSGEPQVKMFFAGTSNPKDSTVQVRRGSGDSARTVEFRIKARPTPTC
jgi:hypothetical protein